MKTTIEITDSLLKEAREEATKEGRTVRELVEEGLRRLLAERKRAGEFHMRKATYKGKGLQREIEEGSWERIRDLVYEGRGG